MRTRSFAARLCAFGVLAMTSAPRPARALPGDSSSADDREGVTPSVVFDDGAPDEVDGEIAVDVRDDASPSAVADLGSKYGLALRPNSAWSDAHDKIEVADVDPAREKDLLDAISHDDRVESAEPMALYRAMFVPDDPLYASKQWHLQRVGAERAWDYTCGAGVTVAVVDTGIACFDKGPFSRGTDLAGTRCQGGFNFVDSAAEPSDDQGHGTHVAGTIAQTTNNGVGAAGLAYCATLMPIKVLTKQGFGTVANVAEGIRFAADAGAQVINLSLGGPLRSRILQAAVEHALAKGVVIVAAAGNSGRSVGFPAAYPGVVAVSATDPNDVIARFSSRGPEVALAAPGVGVTQQTVCNGGRDKCEIFGTFNGTSMASPHVAGAAAMIESLGVTRGSAVRDALLESARSKGEAGDADLYGAGVLDAGAAVSRVFWGHFVARALALAGLALWLGGALGGVLEGALGLALGRTLGRPARKRRGRFVRSWSVWLGAAITSTSLFPLAPLFGLASRPGRLGFVFQLAMRPLGDWDLVFLGPGAHRWMLLASALPAVLLSALGFARSRFRPFIGGVALGSAAFLLQTACSADVAFVGGTFLAWVWVVTNTLVCLWIARTALQSAG